MDTRRLWMMWWSGVFTVVASVHVVRVVGHLSVVVGAVNLPMWISWVLFPLAGLAAGWLLARALANNNQPTSQHTEGSRQLKVSEPATPPAGGQPYCRIGTGYHTVWEDDEEG